MKILLTVLLICLISVAPAMCAEIVVEKERVIKAKDGEDLTQKYKIEKYYPETKELKFKVKESPATPCWRLAHDGAKAIALFESDGITSTINTLFCGTEKECWDEIKRLGLDDSELKIE